MEQIKVNIVRAQFAKTGFQADLGVVYAKSACPDQLRRLSLCEFACGGEQPHHSAANLQSRPESHRLPGRHYAELCGNRDLRTMRLRKAAQNSLCFAVPVIPRNVKMPYPGIEGAVEYPERNSARGSGKGAATEADRGYLNTRAMKSGFVHVSRPWNSFNLEMRLIGTPV